MKVVSLEHSQLPRSLSHLQPIVKEKKKSSSLQQQVARFDLKYPGSATIVFVKRASERQLFCATWREGVHGN